MWVVNYKKGSHYVSMITQATQTAHSSLVPSSSKAIPKSNVPRLGEVKEFAIGDRAREWPS